MKKDKRIKSLFLTAWYPNRYDAMRGLFVRKHAEAVALYADVTVLYLFPDPNIRTFEIEKQSLNPHLNEIVVYYPTYKKGLCGQFTKAINYIRANFIGYKEVKKDNGKPDIIHVNVLTRTGLLARWLKFTQNIPYVITEHWTRYLALNNSYKGAFRKFLTQIVSRNASAIMPVSEQLKNAMIAKKIHHDNYQVVNNVVDDYFFVEPQSTDHAKGKKQVLLVSCFLEKAKNVFGLLNAFKAISKYRDDFELTIVGNGVDYENTVSYYESLNFEEGLLHFKGELSPQEVAKQFQACDFSIIFSNYETFGVVIAESLACGKPMVSTKVGIADDFIDEKSGLLVDVGDEVSFEKAINFMLDHYQNYDSKAIQAKAQSLFGSEPVGMQIVKIYQEAIQK